MKIYAEYLKDSDGSEYRKTTLLCLGNSTKLIGSAVLVNPGSSEPIGDPDSSFIKSFFQENHKDINKDTSNWKTFNRDSTMDQLEKIFNGWYVNKIKEINESEVGESRHLDGVIQLFNCFYLKNPNCQEALDLFKTDSNFVFKEHSLFLDKPVYFGWGTAGKNVLKGISEEIFLNYGATKTPIYDPVFVNNCFYHPGYINRSFKSNKRTQQVMEDFFQVLNGR